MDKKRNQLIKELIEGSKQPLTSEQDILQHCNITEEQLLAACRSHMPWPAIQLQFCVLGLRAARARSMGRIPDGSQHGRAACN